MAHPTVRVPKHSAKDAFYPRTPFRSPVWISRAATTVYHFSPSTAIYASATNHIRATEAPTTTPTATASQHLQQLTTLSLAPYQPQQFSQQSHSPPLYQQPIFRGDPTQPQQPYPTPPMASSEPVRILCDSDGRPLPQSQQPYFPEDDPWNNYGN